MKDSGGRQQKDFKLTRDMVPIDSGDGFHSFTCPLPKGYKRALKDLDLIRKRCAEIVKILDEKAASQSDPFQDIFSEYGEIGKEREEELKSFIKIGRVTFDNRGVYGVWAGIDINSGDVYLSSDVMEHFDFEAANEFRDFFEKSTAFKCHNMDYYWQALLTRQFCIDYFNLLNHMLFS